MEETGHAMITVTRFLNVSMIVRDLDDALRVYEDLFGLRSAYRVAVPQMASDSAIVPVGGGVSYSIELVRPMTADQTSPRPDDASSYTGAQASGILDRFLERRGEGVYRLAFEVEDFEAAVRHLRDQGIRTTYYGARSADGQERGVIRIRRTPARRCSSSCPSAPTSQEPRTDVAHR